MPSSCSARTVSRLRLVAASRVRSEEHTSELQSHSDLHSFPTRRSSDLVLAVADLVVRVFDVYAELLQRQDRLTPKARGRVEGGQVEVAAVVERRGRC